MKYHGFIFLGLLCFAIAPAFGQTSESLVIQKDAAANPWTHLDVKNNPSNFQFAIVSDRHGGGRPGIFPDAIRKLNLLQPEFVMSVGDLIPGYTSNVVELREQWKDVQSEISKLEMPFFYVPGNHDLSTPVQHKEWEERFGRKYYHFIYRNVLFLCLNSQDPVRGIGPEQLDYFRTVLKENQNVRWTLVFLHQPLFLRELNDPANGGTGWSNFEQMLQGRKYTVFAGHLHHYAKYERLGQKYILLSTTGGGSALRGVENYGEFDHTMWLTMSDDGPIMANLLLGGIVDENARSGAVAELVDPAMNRAIEPEPLFVDSRDRGTSTARIRLTNDADIPMHVRLEFEPTQIVDFPDRIIEKVIPPNMVEFAQPRVVFKGKSSADKVGPVSFDWKIQFEAANSPKGPTPLIALDGTKLLPVDTRQSCPPRTKPVAVDGKLNDWGKLPLAWQFDSKASPKKSAWSGTRDCSFNFATQHDSDFLYIALNVVDDSIVTDTAKQTWEQDCVELRLDARAEPERSRGRGRNEGEDILIVSANPGESPLSPRIMEPGWLPEGTKVAIAPSPNGYVAEIAIPAAYLDKKQGRAWDAFRLNVAVDDYDRSDPRDFVFLSWRPDWRGGDNYQGSGTFVRK